MQLFISGLKYVHKRSSCIVGIVSAKRMVFQFAPTSTPEGLQHYELLYREYETESNAAQDLLKQHGYLNMISLRNIDDYPLTMDELRNLRYKLDLQFHIWVDPPLFEEQKTTQSVEEILIKIVNGYKSKKHKSKRGHKQNIHDRLYANDQDEYRVQTPIFYHKTEHKAIYARPADRLMSIIKASKKEVDKSYYGDEDKRYQVFGTQWHKKGSRFYDNDDGLDWDHVHFESEEEEQEKTFKNWDKWGETGYVDRNAGPSDPNDMDPFYYRTPKEDRRKRRPDDE